MDHRAPLSVNPVQFDIGCSTAVSMGPGGRQTQALTHVSEGHVMTQVVGVGEEGGLGSEWQPTVTATLTYEVT